MYCKILLITFLFGITEIWAREKQNDRVPLVKQSKNFERLKDGDDICYGDINYDTDVNLDYEEDYEDENYNYGYDDEDFEVDAFDDNDEDLIDDYEPLNYKQEDKSKTPKKNSKASKNKPKKSEKAKDKQKTSQPEKQPQVKEKEDTKSKDHSQVKYNYDNSNICPVLLKTDVSRINHSSSSSEEICSLKLNYDISKKNEPLFMVKDETGSYHLALPDLIEKQEDKYNSGTGAIQFDKGDTLFVACTGGANRIFGADSTDQQPPEVKCVKGSRVSLHSGKVNKLLNSLNLTCVKPVTGTAKFSEGREPCGNGEGILIELGFQVEGWHKLIEVCFNVTQVRTLFVKHILYGSVIAGSVIDSKRPKFSRGQAEFYRGFNPDDYYKQASEKKTISKITNDPAYFNVSANLFLARGHFAPDADFVFKTWQDLTYFYVNAAPQWQSINQGHWLSVERLARNIGMELGEDLNILTGPYGVMNLLNKNLHLKINKQLNRKVVKEITIPEIEVPDYYWKVIHRGSKNECIVFISTNNPFLVQPKEFCKNICQEYSWPELRDSKKGFVFCCSFDDFKKTVHYVPDYNCTGGILRGPK